MKVFFTWFQTKERNNFERLKDVFLYSMKKHNPHIEIIERHIEYPKEFYNTNRPAHYENIYKLGVWNEIIQKADEPTLLMDCDILILKDITNILNQSDKDITLTTRNYGSANCNGGVILVKPTCKAKEFFQEWYDISCNEFNTIDSIMWRELFKKYKGATQTTLGFLREQGNYNDIIGEIPCHLWNLTGLDWHLFTEETKVIHIKGHLRNKILNYDKNLNINDINIKDVTKVKTLTKLWFEYENEMIQNSPEKYKHLNITDTSFIDDFNFSKKEDKNRDVSKMTTIHEPSKKRKRIVRISEVKKQPEYIKDLKVHFTWFCDKDRTNFERLRNVFVQSFKTHNPEIELLENYIDYPDKRKFKNISSPSHFENIYKLWHWKEAINNATTAIVLMDSDIMFKQNIYDFVNQHPDKDMVFTTRNKSYSDLKCNGGVILVRPTDKAKEFFNTWYDISANEFDPRYNPMWAELYKKYKGATQTTLGFLREQGRYEEVIGEVPCHIWNATPIELDLIDENTKVVHIKSQVRRSILSDIKLSHYRDEKIYKIAKEWFRYEKEYQNSNKRI